MWHALCHDFILPCVCVVHKCLSLFFHSEQEEVRDLSTNKGGGGRRGGGGGGGGTEIYDSIF